MLNMHQKRKISMIVFSGRLSKGVNFLPVRIMSNAQAAIMHKSSPQKIPLPRNS
jgi:hypothetical protein